MRASSLILLLSLAMAVTAYGTGPAVGQQDAEAAQRVAAANNAFAFELYERLREQPGNSFFSPYSIESALAMTYAGARGQTAQEMRSTLGLPASLEEALKGFGALDGRLNAGDIKGQRPYELTVANAIWGQQGYPFHPDFMNLLEEHFRSSVREADFVGASEEARQRINRWVEEQTRNRIREVIPAGVLDEMTRMVLVNAIYFKGRWLEPFEKGATRDADFWTGEGADLEPAPVPTMHAMERFWFYEDEQLKALQMPYMGKELAMLIVLPKQRGGLSALEQALTAQKLADVAGQLRHERVDVALPRFRMETQFELSSRLSAMGMPTAFTEDADFSGIATAEDLFIAAVLHKAFVEVNEEGTEAAAATGVVMGVTAAPAQPREFKADQPFLFVIRDTKTGLILFMGRVVDPR